MQSSHLNSSGEATKAAGCCAAEASERSLHVSSNNRDANKTGPMIDAQTKRDTTVALKTLETSSEAQVGLGKQCAVRTDMDHCRSKTIDLPFSYDPAHSSDGNLSLGDTDQNPTAEKEISKTQNAALVSTPAKSNSDNSEGLVCEISQNTNAVLGKVATESKGDEIASSPFPLSDIHSVTSQPCNRGESEAISAKNAQPSGTLPDKTRSNNGIGESLNAKCTSSGIALAGIALSAGMAAPPSSTMSTGSSTLAVSTTSSSGTLSFGNTVSYASSLSAGSTSLTSNTPSASSSVSAASRRSSFFNEPSKATGPGVVPQMSAVSSSRIPVSMVSERAKQFERGIARKVGIEVKSRSLDPPYSCDVTSQAAGCERLTARQQLPSALAFQEAPRNVALTAESVLSCDNHGQDDGSVVSPECVWIRRASSDQFDLAGIKNDVSHDVFDQKPNQNSTSIGTPMAKAGNIQKLKAFFGETTPRIMEAKAGPRCVVEEPAGEGGADVFLESKKDCNTKCDAASAAAAAVQKSLTFDPASWALERMARGKKAAAWTLASRSHSSHSPGSNVRPKKSSTERDPSSSPKQKEHKTWKGKMAETFKRYGSGTTVHGVECGPSEEVTGTFGIPLELLPPCLVNEVLAEHLLAALPKFVPSVVEMCTRVVEEKALDNQGIYRVPGNSGALTAMIDELNKDPHGLCMESEKWTDVNLVSSMLKLFFRKLPDPLITDVIVTFSFDVGLELYEAVIAANRTENSERRMLKLKKLIHDLPEHNFETLRFLAQHLNKVASHEEVNKMDAHNLAIVFGPTLVRPQDDTMVAMVRDMADQCRVVESIIVHCDWFFSSWDEDVYVPVDEGAEDATPISGMNQELLAKAERLAFPRLPRDSRCKEIVSSFLHAANRKIRSRRKSRSDVLELPDDPTVNKDCPPKKFRKFEKKEKCSLTRYLSERRVTTVAGGLTIRNFRSQSALREASLNFTRHPIRSSCRGKLFGIENAQTRLFRRLSCDPLEPVSSQVSCGSSVCDQNVLTRMEMFCDSGIVDCDGKSLDQAQSTLTLDVMENI